MAKIAAGDTKSVDSFGSIECTGVKDVAPPKPWFPKVPDDILNVWSEPASNHPNSQYNFSTTSELKWGHSTNRDFDTVEIKNEKMAVQNKKLTKDPSSSVASSYSKKSRHSSARKIQVGNLVTAKIEAQSKEKTPSGKHSQAKEHFYDTVIESIGNNLY